MRKYSLRGVVFQNATTQNKNNFHCPYLDFLPRFHFAATFD